MLLVELSWPKQMMGSRAKEGRIIIVDTDDNLASSRLLHPDLHKLFSGPLGSPFMAGIPCRDTLVLYSNRRELKQRIARRPPVDAVMRIESAVLHRDQRLLQMRADVLLSERRPPHAVIGHEFRERLIVSIKYRR